MKFYKLIITISLFSIFINANCQNSDSLVVRNKELLISFNKTNNIGLEFRKQKNASTYFRLGTIRIFTDFQNFIPARSDVYETTYLTVGLQFLTGIEKRHKITKILSLNYGINLSAFIGFYRNHIDNPVLTEDLKTIRTYLIEPGLVFNFGAILKLNDAFYLGAEVLPSLYYRSTDLTFRTQNSNENKQRSISFDLGSQNITVSLIYRWNKNEE